MIPMVNVANGFGLHPYLLPSLVSAVICFALTGWAWKRRDAAGGKFFTLLLFSIAIWSLGYALSLAHQPLNVRLFWYNLSRLGPNFSPILWVGLALSYTGREGWLTPRRFGWLLILPSFTLFLCWTSEYHQLYRGPVSLTEFGSFSYLTSEYHFWYWLEVSYGYLLLLSTILILTSTLLRIPIKDQIITLLVSLFPPLISNFLGLLDLNPLKPYGATTIFFSLSGVVLAWGLFRHRLFDLAPVAREKVLESMQDGMLVTDISGRIVDFNPHAARFITDHSYHIKDLVLREQASAVLDRWPAWVEALSARTSARINIRVGSGKFRRYYEITVSPLTNEHGHFLGHVSILHDLTERELAKEALQKQLEDIKALEVRLREQTVRDPLTGCYNRRFLEEALKHELIQGEIEEYPVSLIMLDIDKFKTVNDTYGHAAGDLVLKVLSIVLFKYTRPRDLICRYGGEEFIIVLPDMDIKLAHERAEKIRTAFNESRIPWNEYKLNATISLGVASYPLHGGTNIDLLAAVDKALYAAKDAGRNCTRTAVSAIVYTKM